MIYKSSKCFMLPTLIRSAEWIKRTQTMTETANNTNLKRINCQHTRSARMSAGMLLSTCTAFTKPVITHELPRDALGTARTLGLSLKHLSVRAKKYQNVPEEKPFFTCLSESSAAPPQLRPKSLLASQSIIGTLSHLLVSCCAPSTLDRGWKRPSFFAF